MENKKQKYNTMKVLIYFISKFTETYNIDYDPNMGRDLKIIKRIKTMFEENENLGDLYSFIDFVFDQNKGTSMSTPYLLKLVNNKLGFVHGQAKKKEVKKYSDSEEWVKKVKDQWDQEFNEG